MSMNLLANGGTPLAISSEAGNDPLSITWASAFAKTAPSVRGKVPGPKSLALYQRCKAHDFGDFPWVVQAPIAFASGAGVTLEDEDGNRYIDLTHGHMSAALGHANPEIAAAVETQIRKLTHLRNQPTEVRAELMERLASITPGDLNLFAFYSSGTEAAEGAMRVARAVTGGHEFVSFYADYHGRTTGAIGTSIGTRMTGPRPGGFITVPNAYCRRCDFGLEPTTCHLHCLNFIEHAIRMNSHGALAGIIAEPITNASGARVFPPGYLKGLREIADRAKVLLIFDEHATGLGRTGTMWAGDRERVVPDVIFFGKCLGNGFPITVVAASERFREVLSMERQSSTHGGQPLACAAALAAINIIERDDLTGHAERAGAICLEFMRGVQERHSIVGVGQGRGLQLAYEFVDPQTGKPSEEIADRVYVATMERGVCTSPVGPTIRVSPMMVTSQSVALKALGIMEAAIAHVEYQL
jgi:4-aminobutyrate aminotransferase/4-aminobutyrate aminotransferase/(S)-3-amino-2-methylpropionate transaminase